MPKEFRVACSERTYESRVEAYKTSCMIGGATIEERDVSEWRPPPSTSDTLQELRRLRTLSKHSLEVYLDATLVCVDNPYEKDAAILFHLIGGHGVEEVRRAVCEMLGVDKLPKQEK